MRRRYSKTHDEARRSHLALQARRDAVARIRGGEIVDVRLAKDAGGALVRARALQLDEDPAGLVVLAVVARRLRAVECDDHDGLHVDAPSGWYRLNDRQILGVVLLVDGEDPYAGNDECWCAIRERVAAHTRAALGYVLGGAA